MAKQAFGVDDPKVEVARHIATTCGIKVTETERCEAATQLYACSKEESIKMGYEFREFMWKKCSTKSQFALEKILLLEKRRREMHSIKN